MAYLWEEHRTFQGGLVVDTTNSFSFNPVANTIGTMHFRGPTGKRVGLPLMQMLVWVAAELRQPVNEVDAYDPGTNMWTVNTPVSCVRDWASQLPN